MGDDTYRLYEFPSQPPPTTFKRNPSYAVTTNFSATDSDSQEQSQAFSSPLKRECSCLNVLQCVGLIVVGCLACAGLAVALINYHSLQSSSQISESQLADVCADFRRNLSFLHIQQSELVENFTDLTELIARGIPQSACTRILALDPSSPSGYYWIRSSTDSAVRVYCDMTLSCGNITGGWMRVAELNMTDNSSQCPVGFSRLSSPSTCGIDSSTAACSSVVFATNALLYNRVCGRILAYQYGSTDAFANYGRGTNLTIDSNYVDGVSLTHGSSPRQHIWTFASSVAPSLRCPCYSTDVPPPPAFVGENYFCDTGNPIWDGAGCSSAGRCCSFNSPPWFHRVLPSPTTQNIEMRVCRDQEQEDEDIGLSLVEIYVQ